MTILYVFYNHPELSIIPRSLLAAFKKEGHIVITCGRSIDGQPLDFAYRRSYVSLLSVLKKLKRRPDLVFMCWPSAFFFLTDIEKSPIPTVVYAVDTHLPLMHLWMRGYVGLFDYVFSAQKNFYEEIKKEKANVFWCPLAVDPRIHKPYTIAPSADVVFAGVMSMLHNPRRTIYLKILNRFFKLKTTRAYLQKYGRFSSSGKIISNIPVTNDLNARVFEALACGRLLLTSKNQQGLEELFVNGKHLVMYEGIIDLVRRARFYLREDVLREKIAYTGRKEVLAHHTYSHRVRFILSQIKKRKLSEVHVNSFRLAISFYFLGAPEVALGSFQNFRSTRKFLLYIQERCFYYYSHFSALQVILWQVSHL